MTDWEKYRPSHIGEDDFTLDVAAAHGKDLASLAYTLQIVWKQIIKDYDLECDLNKTRPRLLDRHNGQAMDFIIGELIGKAMENQQLTHALRRADWLDNGHGWPDEGIPAADKAN